MFLLLISISIAFTLSPVFISRGVLKIACYSMSIFPLLIAFNVAMPTSAVQNKSPIDFFGKIARKLNANVTLVVDGNIVRAASAGQLRGDSRRRLLRLVPRAV